jgi:hypothetical protein
MTHYIDGDPAIIGGGLTHLLLDDAVSFHTADALADAFRTGRRHVAEPVA